MLIDLEESWNVWMNALTNVIYPHSAGFLLNLETKNVHFINIVVLIIQTYIEGIQNISMQKLW